MKLISRSVRPKYIVSGVYEVNNDQLKVTIIIVDFSSQKEIARRVVSGPTSETLDLMRKTSVELLGWLTREEPETIAAGLSTWTRSIPAAKALYGGVDLYDQGRYAEAWLQFRRASKEDPGYVEAQYWVGKMYYFLNRHGHARRAYDRFVYHDSTHPRAKDTVREYVDIYERTGVSNETLLVLYSDLEKRFGEMKASEHEPPVKDSLRRRAGQVLATEHRYDEAIPLLADGVPMSSNRQLAESYMMKHHLLNGYSFGAYDFKRYLGTWLVSPDRLYFAPGRMEHVCSGGGTSREKGDLYIRGGGSAKLFSCPGKLFDSVTVFPVTSPDCRGTWSLTAYTDCRLLEVTRPIQDCLESGITIDKLPRAGWLRIRTTYDATKSITAMRVTAKLRDLEEPHGSLVVSCATTERFRVEVNGRLGRTGPGLIGLLPPGKHTLTFRPVNPNGRHQPWQTTATVTAGKTTSVLGRLPWKPGDPFSDWTAMAMTSPDYEAIHARYGYGRGRPCVQADDDAIRIVWSCFGDLWVSESRDGRTLSAPRRLELPVSTGWEESSPTVLKDESGRFVLIFLSDRDAAHVSRPYACWSRDFIHWSAPAMISDRLADLSGMIQDRNGRYVSMHRMRRPEGGAGPALAHSRDLYRWQVDGPLKGLNARRDQQVLLQRRDGQYELLYIHSGRQFGGWGRHSGLRRTFVRRHTSNDGINWSPFEQLAEVMTNSERLLAVHHDGRTTIMVVRGNLHPVYASLKVFREKPDGTWDVSPWFETVGGLIGDVAYHKRWGYILTWLHYTEDEPKGELFAIRTDSIDELFKRGPSDAVREWEAMDWCDYGRLHDQEGRKDQAKLYFKRVVEGYPRTEAAKTAAARLRNLNSPHSLKDEKGEKE